MKPQNSESTSPWTKAPVANLVRYVPSGIYFARARVRGKLIRKSLQTTKLSVAQLKRAKVRPKELHLPDNEQLMALVYEIESVGVGPTRRCADLVRFLA